MLHVLKQIELKYSMYSFDIDKLDTNKNFTVSTVSSQPCHCSRISTSWHGDNTRTDIKA